MTEHQEKTAAVFLDFDNVYIGLQKVSAAAAERLAGDTKRWLTWFREGSHGSASLTGPRRIVSQRCYLNPQAFGKFRNSFTWGGFEVVDCPPLTRSAKNSADITMVMDVLDLLRHNTRIDEFIILSADADFTPVLRRVRLHDRIATIYANDVTAGALRNSASLLIEQDRFVEEALGIDGSESLHRPASAPPTGSRQTGQASRISDWSQEVRHVAAIVEKNLLRNGAAPVGELGGVILSKYPAFRDSNWLGFGAAGALLDELARVNPNIESLDNASGRIMQAKIIALSDPAQRALDFIQKVVSEAPGPVVAAKVASQVARELGENPSTHRWFNNGSLGNFIEAAQIETLAFDSTSPSYLYDPTQHKISTSNSNGILDELVPELRDFIEYINSACGWPKLAPTQLDLIFQIGSAVVDEGISDVSRLAKEIRDRIDAKIAISEAKGNLSVSQSQVNFVLTAILEAELSLVSNCDSEEKFRRSALDGFVAIYESSIGLMTDQAKIDTGAALFSINDTPEVG